MNRNQYRALSTPSKEAKDDSEVFMRGTNKPDGLREALTESAFLHEREISTSSGREMVSDMSYGKTIVERLATKWFCCCESLISWPKDAWTLLLTTVLFGIITVAQLFCAIIASSLALFGDSISMLVDVITYISNLYAELSSASAYEKKRNQLIAAGFSLAVLMILSFFIIYSATARLVRDIEGDEEVVDPDIVLVFAIIGIMFDILSCTAFWKLSRQTVRGDAVIQDSTSASTEQSSGGSGSQINMISALMHVLSDSVRSLTTLMEAILIKWFGANGEITDAVAGLIMFTIIVAGGIGALKKWWKTVQEFRNPRFRLDDEEQSPRVLIMSSEERDNRHVEMGPITQSDSNPPLSNSGRGQNDFNQSSDAKTDSSKVPQDGSEESPNPTA